MGKDVPVEATALQDQLRRNEFLRLVRELNEVKPRVSPKEIQPQGYRHSQYRENPRQANGYEVLLLFVHDKQGSTGMGNGRQSLRRWIIIPLYFTRVILNIRIFEREE